MDFTIEDIDFEWVKKQKDTQKLNKALLMLGDDYPGLSKTIRKRIQELRPVVPINKTELLEDLDKWNKEMSATEKKILEKTSHNTSSKLPPIRNTTSIETNISENKIVNPPSVEDEKTPIEEINTPEPPLNRAEYSKLKGNECFKANQFAEALKYYDDSIKIYPTAAVFSNKGTVYLRLKLWENAEDACTSALELDPTFVKALYHRSMARHNGGRYAQAISDIHTALKLQPGQNDLLRQLSLSKEKLEDSEGKENAQDIINKIERNEFDVITKEPSKDIKPRKTRLRVVDVTSEKKLNDSSSKEPEKQLKDELELKYKDMKKLSVAVGLYEDQNQEFLIYPKNSNIQDSSINSLLEDGNVFLKNGQYQPAIDSYTSAINSRNLNNHYLVDFLLKRASAYIGIHNFDDAKSDLQVAMCLRPDSSYLFYLRALVNRQLGNLVVARSECDKAILLANKNGEPLDKIEGESCVISLLINQNSKEKSPQKTETIKVSTLNNSSIPSPTTALELERLWRSHYDNPNVFAKILLNIDMNIRSKILSGYIMENIFNDSIIAIASSISNENESNIQSFFQILSTFTKASRFSLSLIMLSPQAKKGLPEIFYFLEKSSSIDKTDIIQLKKIYQIQ